MNKRLVFFNVALVYQALWKRGMRKSQGLLRGRGWGGEKAVGSLLTTGFLPGRGTCKASIRILGGGAGV